MLVGTMTVALSVLARLPHQQPYLPPTATGVQNVTLDHFSYVAPARKLGLRWHAYGGFAKGPNAPVLFYCGNEGPIEVFYNATGALFEHAKVLGT